MLAVTSPTVEGQVSRGLQVSTGDLEDLVAVRTSGQAKLDLPVESTWAGEGWVEGIGTVGRGDYDDALALVVETVHEGQELGDETLRSLV